MSIPKYNQTDIKKIDDKVQCIYNNKDNKTT